MGSISHCCETSPTLRKGNVCDPFPVTLKDVRNGSEWPKRTLCYEWVGYSVSDGGDAYLLQPVLLGIVSPPFYLAADQGPCSFSCRIGDRIT